MCIVFCVFFIIVLFSPLIATPVPLGNKYIDIITGSDNVNYM